VLLITKDFGSAYILAFSDTFTLGEALDGARDATQDAAGIVIEHGWEQQDDPGGYLVVTAPRPDDLRRAVADTDLDVEGVVEFVLPSRFRGTSFKESLQGLSPGLSIDDLSVVRSHVINEAIHVYGYALPAFTWCDSCEIAHEKGRHVR